MALYVDISKKMGNFTLNVKIKTVSKTTALFGLSGSGKSVTLKCIAGVLKPDSGVIVLNDRVLFDSDKHINLPPQERNVGYLPQSYALFPNMNVKENIICGLNKYKRKDRKSLCDKYLKQFSVSEIANLNPHQLSGGQQQRVALARAFATKPELLLLDEPFSALDSMIKLQLELDMLSALKQYEGDVLFVSHDRNEVCKMCDSVCIIENGVNSEVKSLDIALSNPETVSESMLANFDNICKIIDSNKTEFGFTVDKITRDNSKYIAFRSDNLSLDTSKSDIIFEVIATDIICDSQKRYLVLKAINGIKPMLISVSEDSDICINDRITVGLNYFDIHFLK